MITIKEVVTKSFTYKDAEYAIVLVNIDDAEWTQNREKFGAINYNDLDENMKIKRVLNGAQLLLADTIEDCLHNVMFEVDVNELRRIAKIDAFTASLCVATGMSVEEAKAKAEAIF